jgi:predicted transcriptional regulator
MNAKIMFPLSDELKDAVGAYASKNGRSVSDVIRTAIAKEIGFTLPPATPRQKYATQEDRIAAQKARQAERRELTKRLLAEYEAKQAQR